MLPTHTHTHTVWMVALFSWQCHCLQRFKCQTYTHSHLAEERWKWVCESHGWMSQNNWIPATGVRWETCVQKFSRFCLSKGKQCRRDTTTEHPMLLFQRWKNSLFEFLHACVSLCVCSIHYLVAMCFVETTSDKQMTELVCESFEI